MALRTVALLARRPGLNVLDALLAHPGIELAAVYTHPALPNAEGGGERPENDAFRAACAAAGVPLHFVPVREGRELAARLPAGRLDLLVSLSWRCIVPATVLGRFGTACINLHRGALPDYAGAIPVQRAIEAGERRVAITAHRMVEEIDAGDPLAVVWMDVERRPAAEAAAYAEEVKTRLEPLYAPLAVAAIAAAIA